MVSLRDSMDREGSLLSWKNTDFKTIGYHLGLECSHFPLSLFLQRHLCTPSITEIESLSLKCWLVGIGMDTVTSSVLYAMTDRQTSIICEEKWRFYC